eukprot:CAMPEP_0201646594 /NCGR_PEP_ID=MMETSP0493-20130528/34215_1 /ASSEMBLY_ACC=CAM_ASM_000838 /TAXON_ID=420259 /ORGANISM="Thalassiosira gravida, Strain GMp14c1" /LENGTH=58 /DNA_ID=CAMNT_0048121793 /DNA_START=35 /DNA_END=208 /DNA_ORIENTATION=+
MTATSVGYDPYLGRTCTGRIYSGQINSGDAITLLTRQDGDDSSSDNEPSSSDNTTTSK